MFHGQPLASRRRMTLLARMDLDTARRHIRNSLDRMRVAYMQPVFDEWAILAAPGAKGGVLAYEGPRPDVFRKQLPQDAEALRARTAGKELHEGDLEFAPDAEGTGYDAFVKIGARAFLILNHTGKTLNEIRADAKWLGAQAVLFELTEKFRSDPLELP